MPDLPFDLGEATEFMIQLTLGMQEKMPDEMPYIVLSTMKH